MVRLRARLGYWHRPAGAAVLALWVGGAACASKTPFPADWPARTAAGPDCVQVAGEYREHGFAADGGEARLTQWLLGSRQALDRAVAVRIALPPGGGVVADVVDDVAVTSFETTAQKAKCRDGVLQIEADAAWTGNAGLGLFWLGRESRQLQLQPAGDALVIRAKTTVLAVVIAIPWRTTRWTWARFDRLPPPHEPAAALGARKSPRRHVRGRRMPAPHAAARVARLWRL